MKTKTVKGDSQAWKILFGLLGTIGTLLLTLAIFLVRTVWDHDIRITTRESNAFTSQHAILLEARCAPASTVQRVERLEKRVDELTKLFLKP